MGVVGGVLLILIVLVFALLSGGNKSPGLLEIAQTQQELIRVSEIGVQKAGSQNARNLAVSTDFTIRSSQKDMLSRLKKVKPKVLDIKQNKKTDDLLTEAALNNRFDETFEKVIQQQLVEYQKLLKSTYDGTSNQKLQNILNGDFTSAGLLITATQAS